MDQDRSAAHPRTRLVDARMERQLSQRQVAEVVGTTVVNMSRWERGITRPGPYFRRKLCALFGKTAEELDLTYQEELFSPVTQDTPLVQVVQEATAFIPGAISDPAIPIPSAPRLIGRDEALVQMRRRLYRAGNASLLALNGLPGVGKTALAIALARDPDIRTHFKDGILWAGLGPEPHIQNHLSRWGALLGLSQAEMSSLNSVEAWATTLRRAIGSRAILLVIDDAWTVDDALTLKVGGANCAHLVTTRIPAIAAQIAAHGATPIKALQIDEGIALLHLLAPQVVEAERERARELVEAVGGLPLALTLMGNYLRTQAATGQARRITAALHRLSDASQRLDLSETHGPADIHPSLPGNASISLRAIIAVTDRQLPERASHALHALSVLPARPNSFSEEVALAVADCTLDTLDALTDSGLLEITSSGRYTLHQIIADYARQQPQDEHVSQRMSAYLTTCIEKNRKNYEMLAMESSNILAALEAACASSRHDELIRATVAFAPFLLARGLYATAETYLQRAYGAALAAHDHNGLAGVLLYLGEMTWKRGEYHQAEQYLQVGLGYARRIDDHERICALLANLGSISWKRGDYKLAETHLQEGLTLARQLGDLESIARLLDILGSVEIRQGNYSQAETYLQEGLNLARQIEASEAICTILLNLGMIAGERGNYAQAETYFQEGLQLARQLQHSEWLSGFLNNLGDIASEQGHYEQAMCYFQEGLELARQLEHREWISFLILNLGITARKQKNYALSEEYLRESLALARQNGIPQITCYILNEYGNLHLDQCLPDVAETDFREILAIVPIGGQDFIAFAHYGLARVAAARGDQDEARLLGEKSLLVLEEMGRREAKEVKSWLHSLEDSRIATVKDN